MAYTTIDDPEAYFQTVLYAGNSSTQSITLGGDTDLQPDLVWIKSRADAGEHTVYDSVRGATKRLDTADNGAEDTVTNGVTAFNSDGFSLGAGGNENSATTIVAWCWKESATAGFDIVSYTGNGTDDTDISHNLSAVPKMIIVKNRDAADAWQVYHGANTAAPETDYLVLSTVAATADAADRWSDEAPTSSVFTLGDGDEVNTNTENYIAYCFSEKQGFSKFGSYTGNGNADGTFVYTGFRPAMIIFKQSSASGEKWYMFDSKRNPFNLTNELLMANVSDAESVNTTGAPIDILSNGFKIRGTDAAGNASGSTYIYMAFAEAPFVNSNGVPCNAR